MNVLFAASTTADGNMSLHRGNSRESLANRTRFLKSHGIALHQTVSMAAPHGSEVRVVTKYDGGKGMTELDTAFQVDALITSIPSLPLFLIVADCIPLALYDQKIRAIGLIHASRVSLNKGIISSTIDAMKHEFKTNPKDLVAHIGPSIGPCCYKLDHVEQSSSSKWASFIHKEPDGYTINIWGYAKESLQDSGVLKKNIINPHTCTYHSGTYFSHRKSVVNNAQDDYGFAVVLGIV